MKRRLAFLLVGTAVIVVTLGIAVAGHQYGHALDILLASWISLIIGVILGRGRHVEASEQLEESA